MLEMNMTGQQKKAPSIWAITLGFNNAGDTLECLNSILASEVENLRVLLVDNFSKDDTVKRVMENFPSVGVLQLKENTGFARGFNAGMAYAYSQDADYVFMINNDTIVDPQLLARLTAEGEHDSRAAVLVPKIFYYDDPKTVWSAGSRYRPFPPAIVIQKGQGPDDGSFDKVRNLDFATTCALMFPRWSLEKLGLLDINFFFFSEDYDLSLRIRESGDFIRFVPSALMWHKVSKSTKVGSRNDFFWFIYGKSEMIFCRKHRNHRWMTGWAHRLYIILRFLMEGKHYGLVPFLKGMRAGSREPLKPIPAVEGEGIDQGDLLRQASVWPSSTVITT
ncbi:MAG: glycosyltransferase family 2 protein [Lentisphaerota bacterium]